MKEENLPDRRRHGYKELEEKLETHAVELQERHTQHAAKIEDRLNHFFARALAAFAVIGVVCGLALLGFGLVLDGQSQITKDIQTQRFNTLVLNCDQQNRRHDDAIAESEQRLSKNVQGAVIAIIDALQPYVENCVAYANARVKGPK